MTTSYFDRAASGIADARQLHLRPDGVTLESFSRAEGALANGGVLSSGRMTLSLVPGVFPGCVVTSLMFHAWTTGGSGLTHCLFGLYDDNLNRLAVTADDTSATWASSTARTLALTAPYTFQYAGYAYAAIMVAGTTVPTLGTKSVSNATNTMTPMLVGYDNTNTGLTTSLPATSAALTAGLVNWPYVQLIR